MSIRSVVSDPITDADNVGMKDRQAVMCGKLYATLFCFLLSRSLFSSLVIVPMANELYTDLYKLLYVYIHHMADYYEDEVKRILNQTVNQELQIGDRVIFKLAGNKRKPIIGSKWENNPTTHQRLRASYIS